MGSVWSMAQVEAEGDQFKLFNSALRGIKDEHGQGLGSESY